MENKHQNRLAAVSLVIAFVLLIAVFAAVAVGCKRLLAMYIEQENIRTIASLLIAGGVTLAALYGVRAINNRTTKDQ